MCSDAYVLWMETYYPGIYRDKDLRNDWLFCAARDEFPLESDKAKQEALRMMLIVAVDPISIPKNWQASLKKLGWCRAQIQAMAPFAAFHAARIVVRWQAASPRVSPQHAESPSLLPLRVDELR
jgi:hypothetical protein